MTRQNPARRRVPAAITVAVAVSLVLGGITVAPASAAAPTTSSEQITAGARDEDRRERRTIMDKRWARAEQRAAAIAQQRPGTVSFAVVSRNGRLLAGHRRANPVRSASVVKAMMLVAYLRMPDVASRRLTRSERTRFTDMITRSANAPAYWTLEQTGWWRIEQMAREAGMRDFRPIVGAWGYTGITAQDTARFFVRIDRLTPKRHVGFVHRQLAGIIPEHRWGLPPNTPRGWSWHVKGGWINGIVNQAGVFTRGDRRIGVAVLIEDLRDASGRATIDLVGQRLLKPLARMR